MIPTEILNLGAVAIIFILFVKEFFAYLKAKKNGNVNYVTEKKFTSCLKSLEKGSERYERELGFINEKLGNHLTDVNKEMSGIKTEMRDLKTDMAIVKDNVNDIKIAIK